MSMPSAHDVARLAGVSQATVSRAFTPGSSISAKARERVLAAAQKLGYRPNLIAKSLITGKSGLIGVVMGDPRNPFYVEAFTLLSERLSEAGLQIMAFSSKTDEPSDLIIQKLLKYRVDAVLLMSATLTSGLAKSCENELIPVIFFNRKAENCHGTRSVVSTNRAGAREIAAHLLKAGYKRFAYIAGALESSTSRDREIGFSEKICEVGLNPPLRVSGDFDREKTRASVRELLSYRDRPDAIFCANDVMAIATIEVARHEFGLTIGQDIGVAGFDNILQASWPSFDLTTYAQPLSEMVDHVIALLTTGSDSSKELQGRLIIRSSSSPRPINSSSRE